MRLLTVFRLWILPLMLLAVLLFLTAGCATLQWNSRIGNYSYGHAVVDYGMPDYKTKSPDGTVVAEWITSPSHMRTEVETTHIGTIRNLVESPPRSFEYRVPDYILRLTFGPDGKLTAWKKFAR